MTIASTPVVESVQESRVISSEQIALRAYEIYQERGGSDGADLDDRLQAERELQNRSVSDGHPVVHVDDRLIFEARRITNGANVHKVKELIFAYEQAVCLHNKGWRAHDVSHVACENSLRRYVARHRAANVHTESVEN